MGYVVTSIFGKYNTFNGVGSYDTRFCTYPVWSMLVNVYSHHVGYAL